MSNTAQLKNVYTERIAPALMKQFNYSSPMQIPCIERNAFAATRALDSNLYAALSDGRHRVSFDRVVKVMKQTGHDLPSLYKETSEGGLARAYQQHLDKKKKKEN